MEVRVNKYLSSAGVCSRREADRLIEDGRVSVNGQIAEAGMKVRDGDDVRLDGRSIEKSTTARIIAYYKPEGIICTTSEKERPNLNDVLKLDERLFPIGRLDKDSSGLILLTNDGNLADRLMRGRNGHEKEYVVETDKPMSAEVIRAMEQGVPILDTMTRPCKITGVEGRKFHITLTQGLNRQIRRMCDYFGYRVKKLKRIRFVTVNLGDLNEGKYRDLTDEEVKSLYAEVEEDE